MSPRLTAAFEEVSDDRKAVVDAAIRCFEQYGPQRTSMADIADEAQISRRTLYRIFDDRRKLIDAIIQQRLTGMAAEVTAMLTQYDDFEELLVEVSLASDELFERDKTLLDVVRHAYGNSLERLLISASQDLRPAIVERWKPVLEPARAKGILRDNLTNERAVDLIVQVQVLVLVRDDLDSDDRRQLLRDVLVPALIKDSHRR